VANLKVLVGDLNCEYNVVDEVLFRNRMGKYIREHGNKHLLGLDTIDNVEKQPVGYK